MGFVPLNKSTTIEVLTTLVKTAGGGGMVKISRNEVKLSARTFLKNVLNSFRLLSFMNLY